MDHHQKLKKGITLIEVLIASAIALLLGLILVYDHAAWGKMFKRHISIVDLRNEALKAESIARDLQAGYQNDQSPPTPPQSNFPTPIVVEQDANLVPQDNNFANDYNCLQNSCKPGELDNHCGNVVSFIGGESVNIPGDSANSFFHVITYSLVELGAPPGEPKVLGLERQDVTVSRAGTKTSKRTILGYYHSSRDYLTIRYFKVRALPIGELVQSFGCKDTRSYALFFKLRVGDASGRKFPEKDLVEFSGDPRIAPPPKGCWNGPC